MSTPMDDLARRVREERRRRGWSQADLAKAASVSVNTISNFETRKYDLQGENLRAVCLALDFPDPGADAGPGEDADEDTQVERDWDTEVYLDIIGMYLDAYPPEKRPALMRELYTWLRKHRP